MNRSRYSTFNQHHRHWQTSTTYSNQLDFDTNSTSYYNYLAEVNHYLHYLDHLFSEMQDVINDLLQRVTDLEDLVEDLQHYKHVPAILVKINSTKEYIKVDNVNRTSIDGLPSPLVDEHKQKHRIDTSLLDKIIDNLIENTGLREDIVEDLNPKAGDTINLGDICKYDYLEITFNAQRRDSDDDDVAAMSIPPVVVQFGVSSTGLTGSLSLTYTNVDDRSLTNEEAPYWRDLVGGSIGQTLFKDNGRCNGCVLTITEIARWGFRVNDNDFISHSTDKKNWLHIIKITGVAKSIDILD